MNSEKHTARQSIFFELYIYGGRNIYIYIHISISISIFYFNQNPKMDNDTNCVNIINRASNKRSFPILANSNHNHNHKQIQSTKKRVVLGDITNSNSNSGDVSFNRNSDIIKQNHKQSNTRHTLQECLKSEVSVSFGSDKFLYAPLIYQHLHSLEVFNTTFYICKL